MKAELSLFGFLVTPRNYYTGVSETAQSTYDCSRFAPGGMLGRVVPPSFETRGTLRFPVGSGRVGGKEGGWDSSLGLLMLLRGGGQSGVCLSSASVVRIWDPTLGLEFEEGATRSGADVESRMKLGYLSGRLEVEALVQAGEVERRTVLRV